MSRLNDTEALTRQVLRRETCRVAPVNSDSGIGDGQDRSPEKAVTGPNSRFRRETSAGHESLDCAVDICKE